MKKKIVIICLVSIAAIAGVVAAIILLNNRKEIPVTDANTTNQIETNTKTKDTNKKETKKKTQDTSKSQTDNTTTTEEKKKTYTCPTGYTLSGTKSTITESAIEECPSGYTWSSKVKKCVAQTTTIPGECPSGYTWSDKAKTCYTTSDKVEGCSVEGYGKIGNGECGLQPVNPSAQNNKDLCEHYGMKLGKNGYCYSNVMSTEYVCPRGYEEVFTKSRYGFGAPKAVKCAKETSPLPACPSGYKLYHSDPNFGAGDRCVKLAEKEKTCSSGYTLSGSNYIKTIDATLE